MYVFLRADFAPGATCVAAAAARNQGMIVVEEGARGKGGRGEGSLRLCLRALSSQATLILHQILMTAPGRGLSLDLNVAGLFYHGAPLT